MRRYCFRDGSARDLADTATCPECGRPGADHPAVSDQSICGSYAPVDADTGTACVLPPGHLGKHRHEWPPMDVLEAESAKRIAQVQWGIVSAEAQVAFWQRELADRARGLGRVIAAERAAMEALRAAYRKQQGEPEEPTR